ncbi:MAG: enoyl-CoA hydratase [Betaproteobacteria bacterium HGW-Betaproteobacteria-13]|jgi:enoyl-CoA hydratase/carnithine racemase|uniref:Enoyl-CoA hydratase n=1 Tax=Parazoarcus communis TaxID=41977 RepID=A0A2U8GWX8_9RHOO|nr:enoyl-CoA hydratase-related protein [Parazoarcus communis]AWI77900.1 enoyl-CoA hydratase [Parazoarcus communis]PKO82529.1 MAG: enoyl-CoA hydratase [Betaproteobacteria bacterium HGW-Betaproteobacteria-13]PLX72219.1 MAG: enoyl-CoA hydratase [Azoarcus sp.]
MTRVLETRTGGVLRLTINRPEVRNALDGATYRGLTAALAAADADAEIAAVVLTGAGGHFTAGNDLKDFQQPREGEDRPAAAFLRQLAAFGKPLIAAVEGSAVGIGVTLLLHCDFVYAGDTARFRMPFVPLGLTPEGGSSLLLPKLVGVRKARDWLLRGRAFDTVEALDAGLLTGAVAAGTALAEAEKVAQELAGLPAEAVRLTKAMLHGRERSDLSDTLAEEFVIFSARLHSAEAQAAFAGFFAAREVPSPQTDATT